MGRVDVRDNIDWPAASLLGRLPPGGRAVLLDAGTRVAFQPSELLLKQGDQGRRAEHALLLLSGCVKVVAVAENGGRALLAVRVGGDLVGEMALLDGGPRSADVVAASRVEARRIGKTQLTDLIHAHPDVGMAITQVANERLRWANRRRVDFVSVDAPGRIARVLTEIAEAYGEPDPRGIRLGVSLTQEDIASLAGQRLATAERALKKLEDDGMIQRGYRQILIIEPDRLRGGLDHRQKPY
jgi:CRP-like cAMP-binding protein